MSKKHFIAMAIQFAQTKKEIINSGLGLVATSHMLMGYTDAVMAFCRVAKNSNPNFDHNYFLDFIDEIVEGKRDTFGKLIKTKKMA